MSTHETVAHPIDEGKKIEHWKLRCVRLISLSRKAEQAGRRTKHCPATFLLSKRRGKLPGSEKGCHGIAPDHYDGYFNTDHLLPSVFFQEARDPKDIPLYQNLDLKYITMERQTEGPCGIDAGERGDLVRGKRNLDRLPRSVDAETVATLTPKMEAN